MALAGALNAHDRMTRGHTERVRAYTLMIGEELHLPKADLDRLHWAGLVHDIGKLEVPPSILNKPGRPDEDEWEILKQHPAAAVRLLEPLRPWLGEWADAASQHHERWDGKGYPFGLAGEQISLSGRIVAVADAFDVMTSVRSYKKAMTPEAARAELLRCAGHTVRRRRRASVPEHLGRQAPSRDGPAVVAGAGAGTRQRPDRHGRGHRGVVARVGRDRRRRRLHRRQRPNASAGTDTRGRARRCTGGADR